MKLQLIFLVCFFVIKAIHCTFTVHREEILKEGNTIIKWDVDFDEKYVRFNITMRTEGWIGFGISPSGGMTGADLIIGGVDSEGNMYFSDRHATGTSMPVEDDSQDWTLLEAKQTDGFTSLIVSRPFDTCDEQDVVISLDTTTFIYARSPNNSDILAYHTFEHRGSISVQPLDPEYPAFDGSNYLKYNLTIDVLMPSKDTTYWCSIQKSPYFTSVRHIVAFESLVISAESKAHTHHFNIYKCVAPTGSSGEEYFGPYIGRGEECYVEGTTFPVEHCLGLQFAWAVGGKMYYVLPEEIGYPIGGHSEPEYYLFELHLNNPTELQGVELQTGVNIYYTEELRSIEAGMMTVGHLTSIAITIPPDSGAFKLAGHCDPICTDKYLPLDGINVFAVNLHSHMSGRKIKYRQFRGNQELPWPANDDSYNFEFQQTRPLRNTFKILPGDHLTAECVYDNTWKKGETTVGGLSSKEEMCLIHFFYYPRVEMVDCRSEIPIHKYFDIFGIESANWSYPYDDAVITAPERFAGMRYTQVLDTVVEWTTEKKKEIEQVSLAGPHIGLCWTETDEYWFESTQFPNVPQYQPEPRKCGDDKSESGGGELVANKLSILLLCITAMFMFAFTNI